MFLRKLTDEEIGKIKKSKDAANKIIKMQRHSLQVKIKSHQRARLGKEVDKLYQQLDKLPVITGLPVLVKIDDKTLFMNYDLLKKFDRSLDKSDFSRIGIEIQNPQSLIIWFRKYGQNGTLELYGLPQHQVELLIDLPTVDLKEWS